MNRRDFLEHSFRLSAAASAAGVGWPTATAGAQSGERRPPASGPLLVPRYFADAGGRAVYLTGSHVWNNLVEMGPSDPPPRFDYSAYLDFRERLDHNFIRLDHALRGLGGPVRRGSLPAASVSSG